MYEAGRRELLGRNVSEGVEPRKFIWWGEPTVYSYWKAAYCLNEKASLTILPGVRGHGMITKGTVRNLGEPDYSLWGNLQTTGRREDVREDNLVVGLTHSTLRTGKPATRGRG